MKNILINGYNLGFAKSMTGIQRACHELIYRVDTLASESDFKIYYLYDPNEANIIIKPQEFINIIPLPVPKEDKFLFKTKTIKKMTKEKNAILCCLSLETVPVKNQISFIYDIRAAVTKFDTFKFRLKYKIYLFLQKKFVHYYLTDSNYQKKELSKYLRISEKRITTIYMGYEHFLNVKSDSSIFDRFKQLKKGEYYYTIGSLAPHKNFTWVAEVAKKNPSSVFAIAGGKDLKVWKDNIENKTIANLIFLGYVSDEESKALIENCKLFLHPSKYEGFGIPPLEALSAGAKVAVSNATCLPEIYEDTVTYFDPDNYNVNLINLFNEKTANPKKVFEKCSWDKSAILLYDIFKKASKE